jgi:DNA-binding MarR family transcriptional regulator
MSASRLAERVRLQPQSLTRIIAAPENQNYIERRRNAVDRRELVIVATESGRQPLADDMRGRSIWLDRAMMQTLSRAEDLLAAARSC